jgi:hypothetical protein
MHPPFVLIMQEMNECVVETMRFILAKNQAEPMVPVRWKDVGAVLSELNPNAKGARKEVMARVRVGFMGLGWDVVEVASTGTDG